MTELVASLVKFCRRKKVSATAQLCNRNEGYETLTLQNHLHLLLRVYINGRLKLKLHFYLFIVHAQRRITSMTDFHQPERQKDRLC